jgi:glycosyltransferase involved in cell wall biosynthesis
MGSISARKAQRDFVEAMALLPRAVLERVQVFLVGEDRNLYAKNLKQRCRAFSPELRERIRFFPSTESVQRFYEAADIFVLCSKEESFPRVILEAMAFGLPIIATPVHGVTEQCVEEENALFYPNGNAEALAGKIESLVKDEILRKKNMGQSSLHRLSKLKSFEEMTEAYASVLQQAAMKNY